MSICQKHRASYPEPIVNLTDRAILDSPYYTESITKAWVSRMIDAGWAFWYGEDNILFRHCDSLVMISPSQAKVLVKVFWRRLLIPSPYNLEEVLSTPPIKTKEAKPLGGL